MYSIANVFRHRKSGKRYLVKWRELPYEKSTWENLDDSCMFRGAEDAIRQYEKLRSEDSF